MTPSLSTSARIAVALNKIGLVLKHHAWKRAGERGLTPTQAQILTLLHTQRDHGLRLSEIAQSLGITSATACDAVAALHQKKLLRKSQEPEDARALRITLTAKGQRQAEQAAGWPDALLRGLQSLSETEQAILLRALTKLIREFQLQAKIPLSGMCVSCVYFRPNVHPPPSPPHHCAFVDAAFGDSALQLECPDQVLASPEQAEKIWIQFLSPHQGVEHDGI
ncbi:MAG: MarR family winged helix-turn-helix transcriptional regulator [Bryobacteraceae bacterium]|nr:MarR family winged helix-turn-helix transcriptional regulator [Bryobacteraceae bacterium]MDW8378400.1 MarR family winged helix-turn-helix transcriptional regulator [Bryobacterales bacterium]